MPEFTVTIDTEPGIGEADDFLDRLADVVYADERFIAPALGLEQETRSVTFTFNVEAETFQEATERGTQLVAEAVERVRGETVRKLTKAAFAAIVVLLIARVVVERAEIELGEDEPLREKVPA